MSDDQKVAMAIRDSIIKTAKKADALKAAAISAAKVGKMKANKAWDDSKPAQQKAKEDLKMAKAEMKKLASEVSSFSKQVMQGMKDGISEVKKMHGQK